MFPFIIYSFHVIGFTFKIQLCRKVTGIKSTARFKLISETIKGEIHLQHTCFYCWNETQEKQTHLVTFHVSNQEREEKLCHECYQEWLLGIKG